MRREVRLPIIFARTAIRCEFGSEAHGTCVMGLLADVMMEAVYNRFPLAQDQRLSDGACQKALLRKFSEYLSVISSFAVSHGRFCA
jgi:hypothetical protein